MTMPSIFNSPETAAYIKGRNLFGLHLTAMKSGAMDSPSGRRFLDLIVPYQLEFVTCGKL